MSALFILLWVAAGAVLSIAASAAMVALAEQQAWRGALAAELASRRSVPWGLTPLLGALMRLLLPSVPHPAALRSLLCDVLLMSAFAYLAWRWGASWPLLVLSAYLVVLLVVAGTDMMCRLIPNRVIAPAAVFAIAVSPTMPQLSLLSALIGGALGFVLLLLPALVVRGGMGAGDVKLAGFIGLAVGFPAVLTALFAGIILGGVATLALLATRRVSRQGYIPYGPFLAAGAALVLLTW